MGDKWGKGLKENVRTTGSRSRLIIVPIPGHFQVKLQPFFLKFKPKKGFIAGGNNQLCLGNTQRLCGLGVFVQPRKQKGCV